MYRCVVSSLEGFVQQVAVGYIAHGYYFYVSGFVPEGKCAEDIDRKLLDRYQVDVSKWARARRKELGFASVQYVRLGRLFVLLATQGQGLFFDHEKNAMRDIRTVPLRVGGYSISSRGGHAHVRIDLPEYRRLKAHLLELAWHRRGEAVALALNRVPFEPYAPVRRQVLCIWRAVNRARKTAGFELVSKDCLRFRRRIVRPFEDAESLSRAP